MADDVTYQANQTASPDVGTVIATDDVGGRHFQKVKIDIGSDGSSSTVTMGNPIPTFDYTTLVALGRVNGNATWNKFGYNDDIDNGQTEVIAAFGGAFDQRLTSPERVVVSSTTSSDTLAGTGIQRAVIFGVDSDWNTSTEVLTMNGTSPVTSSTSYYGINRMTVYQSGTGDSNLGTITATAITSGNVMATMPELSGTTQQSIFYVAQDHQFLADWLYLNCIKTAGGAQPVVQIKGYVYSYVVNSKFEVFRDTLDTAVEARIELTPLEPFIIGEKSILWFEATTDQNNTSVRCRFSGKLIKDP